jgi:hypothetical protein
MAVFVIQLLNKNYLINQKLYAVKLFFCFVQKKIRYNKNKLKKMTKIRMKDFMRNANQICSDDRCLYVFTNFNKYLLELSVLVYKPYCSPKFHDLLKITHIKDQ